MGLFTVGSEPERAPDRNPWTKQPFRPWPRSQERRARGFPPAPSLTRIPGLSGSSRWGSASKAGHLLSAPFLRPSPHARRARSRAGHAGGARARGRGRKADRALHRGGERAGAFLGPAVARIPAFRGRRGKGSGHCCSGAPGRGGERRAGGPAPGTASLRGTAREASADQPAGSLGSRLGDAVMVGGPWAGAPWHPCSCGPEGLARRRKGETHQEGSLWRDVLTWDSSSPWLWCPSGGGTFQAERSKFSPGTWTADFFFSVQTHPRGKVGRKTPLLPAWQLRGARMG